MEYFVLAQDGKEYGPASFDTLKQWASDGRLQPQTQLRDSLSGQIVPASTVNGIFTTPTAPSPYANAPDFSQVKSYQANYLQKESVGPLMNVIVRCVLAIVFFFFLHGIGLVFAGYAMYYAVRLNSNGSKYGVPAMVVAGITLLALGVGWFLRMNGNAV